MISTLEGGEGHYGSIAHRFMELVEGEVQDADVFTVGYEIRNITIFTLSASKGLF